MKSITSTLLAVAIALDMVGCGNQEDKKFKEGAISRVVAEIDRLRKTDKREKIEYVQTVRYGVSTLYSPKKSDATQKQKQRRLGLETAENLLIITDPTIARKYLGNWERCRWHSEEYL